jgi:hypothetical protein
MSLQTPQEQAAYYRLSAIAHRHSLSQLDLAHRCELRAFELESYGTAPVHHGYREIAAAARYPEIVVGSERFVVEHFIMPKDIADDIEIVVINGVPVRSAR